MSVVAVPLTGIAEAHADVTPTTVTTSLSDGTNSGLSLTEPVGTAVTDTATLSGDNASTATGTVTYNVYSDAACTMQVNGGSAQTITTAGTPPASAPVTLNIPGAYYWQAVYSGDTANGGSESTCGLNGEVEIVSAGSAPTSVSTTLSGDGQSAPSLSVPAGTTVTDTASLSGDAAGSATGTVTYDVYSDAGCTDLVNSGAAETITTQGTPPPSAGVTLSTPGTYYWEASYSGDADNAPSVSTCGPSGEVETVTSAETTVTTMLSGDGQTGTAISVPAGTSVTDTATMAGTDAWVATGSVTYTVYSDPACTTEVSTATVAITTPGTLPAAPPVTLTIAGTYYWQVAYGGDLGNAPSVSTCGQDGEVETVALASTSVAQSLSGGGQSGTPITVPAGTPVTDTATLSGSDAVRATGMVTYTVYSDASCTDAVAGTTASIAPAGMVPSAAATLTIAGKYYWQVSYSGDGNNLGFTTPCGPSDEVETVTPQQQSTSLTTVLSGGSQTGMTISVPAGTPVADAATLSGADAGVATGTVTYTVYSNAACTTAVNSGTAENVAAGTLPASAQVTLNTPGTYYWQASYSGDLNNSSVKSTCGSSGIETVTPAPLPVTLTASLLSAPKNGTSISVPAGTSVRDSVHLAGVNAAKATGTVTYRVYSNATCTTLAATAGTVTVTGGAVPGSAAEALTKTGAYYWTASYSGDSGNQPAASACQAVTEIVTPPPAVDAKVTAQASHAATVKISTPTAGDLLVAFVSGRGPAGKSQTATVSGGLKWTLVGRESTGQGDAEVWYAKAGTTVKLSNLSVTATERYTGSNVSLTVVAFKNAAGIGKHAGFHSTAGAPAGSLITSDASSWVFAAGDDWLHSAGRTTGSGQALYHESSDSSDTYWVQSTSSVTSKAGTKVTINDTKPPKDPYNLVLIEILAS